MLKAVVWRGLRRICQVEATAWSSTVLPLTSGHVMCSVPQGSVLGPLLFILYMADLADIAAQYNLTLHAFDDDNQLYIHCKPENVQLFVASVQQRYCY